MRLATKKWLCAWLLVPKSLVQAFPFLESYQF